MRAHHLAEKLGITNEQLGDFLESIGEKRSHLAGVSDEAAELAREHFWGVPATDEDQAEFIETHQAMAEQATARIKEQSAAEAFAANPEGDAVTEEIPMMDRPLPSAALRPLVPSAEALDTYAEHLATQNDDEPTMPAEDAFHLVETGEEFCLDPTTAERLRAALKGRQIANACVHVDRCECIAVTWPCYQKITVRTDG